MPTARLSTGIEMYYEEVGKGEPLVLIHGTGSDHSLWANQMPEFSKEFRCITLDMRGSGQTSKPAAGFTVKMLADDVAALLDSLAVERAQVAGVSLGGAVTQELALNHPKRVISLAIISSWAKSDQRMKLICKAMERLAALGEAYRELYLHFSAQNTLSRSFLNSGGFEAYLEMRLEYPYRPPMDSLVKMWRANGEHDTIDRLVRIDAPTLVVGGEEDAILPPDYSREISKRVPNSEVHIFTGPSSGHLLMLERPEEFNSVLLHFFRKHLIQERAHKT